jgi:thiamine-phosphate pyrophosphorylase
LNTSGSWPGQGLYAITNGPRADLLDAARQALAGGARLLQYRDGSSAEAHRHEEAAALKQLCDEYGARLIIDNDVELARSTGAHGVHLDMDKHGDDISLARGNLGERAIIGVSCGNSLERARMVARSGASYMSFGAFFPSPTKPHAPHAPIELLRQSAALGLPLVAIGGITPDNGAPLIEAGADYLAAISAVFGTSDIRTAAQRFADLYSYDRESAR